MFLKKPTQLYHNIKTQKSTLYNKVLGDRSVKISVDNIIKCRSQCSNTSYLSWSYRLLPVFLFIIKSFIWTNISNNHSYTVGTNSFGQTTVIINAIYQCSNTLFRQFEHLLEICLLFYQIQLGLQYPSDFTKLPLTHSSNYIISHSYSCLKASGCFLTIQ